MVFVWATLIPAAFASDEDAGILQGPEFADQILRTVQYEQILRTPVSVTNAICIDGLLGWSWRLPDDPGAAPETLAKIESTVSRAHENCLARHSSEGLRMTLGLREVMNNQRRVALMNERTEQARRCFQGSSNGPATKACIEEAQGQVLTTTQWTRWNALLQLARIRQ